MHAPSSKFELVGVLKSINVSERYNDGTVLIVTAEVVVEASEVIIDAHCIFSVLVSLIKQGIF